MRRRCSATMHPGAGQQWQGQFISAYATMHPLEDFAEVFGHFLHIADTLQTAGEFGLLPQPDQRDNAFSTRGTARKLRKSLLERPMAEVVGETWLPVSKGLNQINRSMGKPDLYPFVLAAAGDRKAGVRCGSSRRCRAVP